MYQMLADEPGFDDRRPVRRCATAVVAGGLAPVPLLRRFAEKGVLLEAHYGGTEMGPAVMALSPVVTEKMEAGSVGRPVLAHRRAPHRRRRARRAGRRRGRGLDQGPSVTPGYWGKDNAQFFTDGWFRTGDVARRDDEGYYYLVDRVKDMYKSGGENVYPAEVETPPARAPGDRRSRRRWRPRRALGRGRAGRRRCRPPAPRSPSTRWRRRSATVWRATSSRSTSASWTRSPATSPARWTRSRSGPSTVGRPSP